MPTCPNCNHTWKQARKKKIYSIQFNYETAKFEGINGEFIIWKEKFPAINIESEIKKAEAWCYTNPDNKKSDWKKFLGKWLMRAQDKAPTINSIPITSQVSSRAREELREALKNEDNKTMPQLNEGAKKLFFSKGVRWDVLQRRLLSGEDVLSEVKTGDFKSAAANDID